MEGEPPGTAIRVGTAIWLAGHLPGIALLSEIGFLSGGQAVLSAVWGLGEAYLASWIAAGVSREPKL